MVGWDVVAAVAERTAVLVVGVVGHTDFEQQEPAAVELAPLGERMAAHILQRPEADKGCIVGSQGVGVVVVVAETVPAVRVAVAVVVAAAGQPVVEQEQLVEQPPISGDKLGSTVSLTYQPAILPTQPSAQNIPKGSVVLHRT